MPVFITPLLPLLLSLPSLDAIVSLSVSCSLHDSDPLSALCPLWTQVQMNVEEHKTKKKRRTQNHAEQHCFEFMSTDFKCILCCIYQFFIICLKLLLCKTMV